MADGLGDLRLKNVHDLCAAVLLGNFREDEFAAAVQWFGLILHGHHGQRRLRRAFPIPLRQRLLDPAQTRLLDNGLRQFAAIGLQDEVHLLLQVRAHCLLLVLDGAGGRRFLHQRIRATGPLTGVPDPFRCDTHRDGDVHAHGLPGILASVRAAGRGLQVLADNLLVMDEGGAVGRDARVLCGEVLHVGGAAIDFDVVGVGLLQLRLGHLRVSEVAVHLQPAQRRVEVRAAALLPGLHVLFDVDDLLSGDVFDDVLAGDVVGLIDELPLRRILQVVIKRVVDVVGIRDDFPAGADVQRTQSRQPVLLHLAGHDLARPNQAAHILPQLGRVLGALHKGVPNLLTLRALEQDVHAFADDVVAQRGHRGLAQGMMIHHPEALGLHVEKICQVLVLTKRPAEQRDEFVVRRPCVAWARLDVSAIVEGVRLQQLRGLPLVSFDQLLEVLVVADLVDADVVAIAHAADVAFPQAHLEAVDLALVRLLAFAQAAFVEFAQHGDVTAYLDLAFAEGPGRDAGPLAEVILANARLAHVLPCGGPAVGVVIGRGLQVARSGGSNKQAGRLLDYACGFGYFVGRMAEHAFRLWHLVSLLGPRPSRLQ